MNSLSIIDRNEYMNHFLEQVTSENIYTKADEIPGEIGKVLLDRKKLQKGILYLDWSMTFNENLDVRRKGNYGRDEIQIIFNLNRDVEWKIEDIDQLVSMKKGEVCIYRNNDCTTSMCYPGQCTFLFKSIQIPTEYFRKLLLHYFTKEQVKEMEEMFLFRFTKVKMTPAMYRILHDMDEAERFCEYKELYLEGKLIEMLSVLLHSVSYEKTEKIEWGMPEEDKKQIMGIKDKIDENPAGEWRNENLAKSVHMSVTKLRKGFLQLYGLPIHTYVIRKRLEYAAFLLSMEKCNVSEAAAMAGYTNLSHFSNSFKKQYGVLPKDYKNENC